MRCCTLCFLLLTGSVLCFGIPAGAQTQDATKPQSTPPTRVAAPEASASPVTLTREITKKAQQAGFRAQLSKGAIMFCRNDAAIGTRISSTRCLTENEFDNYLVQLKYAQDNIKRAACGGNCNGAKGQTP
jgi:hypothetical protein